METTPFDLTPEQKGMLAALSRETGKPIPALIAAALQELHERAGHPYGERQAGDAFPADARQREGHRPFWQRFLEASRRIGSSTPNRLSLPKTLIRTW